MVTCQSANQLKTPAKVSWAFKMVSVWFTRLHNHGEDCWVWRKAGEAHSPSCLKSSVKFPQSVMIGGAMSSAGVAPLCFLKTNITALVYQDILEHFMLPSADQLFKDADFIFQQDLAPVHTAKSTKSWLNESWCAWLASKLTRPEHRESTRYCQDENEKQETWMQMSWRPLSQKPGLHTTSAVPQTDHLHATPNWGGN